MPGSQGGTNWYPPSYSPQTGLFYMSVWENYQALSGKAALYPVGEGQLYTETVGGPALENGAPG